MTAKTKKDQVIKKINQVIFSHNRYLYNYQNLIFGPSSSFELWRGLCDAEHFYQQAFRAVMTPESHRDEFIKEADRLYETKEFISGQQSKFTILGEKSARESIKTALFLHDIAKALKSFSQGFDEYGQKNPLFIALGRSSAIFSDRVSIILEAIKSSSYCEIYQKELSLLASDNYISPLQLFFEEDEWVIDGEWSKVLNDPTSGKGLMARMEEEVFRSESIEVLEKVNRKKKKSE
ncbi:hypothetical protein [Seinonella peptonophila]|nr:hypothetical protein [Seinonella peptonophila]